MIYFYLEVPSHNVGLLGLDPSLEELLAKQILHLLALSTTTRGVQTKVSPKVVGEGAGTKFPHPWDVLMWSRGVANHSVVSRHSRLVSGFHIDPCRCTFLLMKLL